jgi:hypothetical protein
MVAPGHILSAMVEGTFGGMVVLAGVLFVSLILPIMLADELASDRKKKPVTRRRCGPINRPVKVSAVARFSSDLCQPELSETGSESPIASTTATSPFRIKVPPKGAHDFRQSCAVAKNGSCNDSDASKKFDHATLRESSQGSPNRREIH